MPKPIHRLLSASGVASQLLLLDVSTMSGQDRAPAVRPSWRLMIHNSRAWGLGGGTPNGPETRPPWRVAAALQLTRLLRSNSG